MEVQGKEIELPTLASNPFSTLPLEANEDHLLVGRVHVRDAMTQYIQFKSPRRILLSGEMGSGRSSLLRCLSNYAPKSVHIDHISQRDSALGLLREIYGQLTGTQAPAGWSHVAEKLVEASNAHHHSLPLIVIDAQHVEMELLSQALRSASATLNRVRCVLIVVIETMQKAQFPERLLHIFDSDFYLEPLTINEVQALVESRITTVSSEPFTLSFEDARYLREKSHGNPGALIRILRNAVDASRNPGSLAGIDQILSLPTPPGTDHADTPTPQYNRNPSASPDEVTLNEQHDPQRLQGGAAVPAEDRLTSELPPESPEESEYIDASTPWTERQTLRSQEDDVKIIENVLGFELNLEQLDEEKSSDAELPELPYKALPQTPEFAAAAEASPPTIVNGPFSGLVGRLRDTKASPGSEEQAGTELWLTEGNGALPELTPEPTEVDPDDSAELIHDEVGMFVPEVDESEGQLLESIFSDTFEVVETDTPEPMPDESDALAAALQALIMAMSGSSSTSPGTGSKRAFIDALANLQQKPTKGHEEYHLDTFLLSNLNASEMAVLAVAEQRKFSPSDQALLADLGVKRSRLSQICSRLLKGGVLNARTSGRQRFYTMTSTARAQLAAWGVKGGEA
jgi:hypothetical protein